MSAPFFLACPVAATGLSCAILSAAISTSFISSSSSKIGGPIRARFGFVAMSPAFSVVMSAAFSVAVSAAFSVAEFFCGDD